MRVDARWVLALKRGLEQIGTGDGSGIPGSHRGAQSGCRLAGLVLRHGKHADPCTKEPDDRLERGHRCTQLVAAHRRVVELDGEQQYCLCHGKRKDRVLQRIIREDSGACNRSDADEQDHRIQYARKPNVLACEVDGNLPRMQAHS